MKLATKHFLGGWAVIGVFSGWDFAASTGSIWKGIVAGLLGFPMFMIPLILGFIAERKALERYSESLSEGKCTLIGTVVGLITYAVELSAALLVWKIL